MDGDYVLTGANRGEGLLAESVQFMIDGMSILRIRTSTGHIAAGGLHKPLPSEAFPSSIPLATLPKSADQSHHIRRHCILVF
jgi:hypothetical protein|tara:strand:+ start:162 stop:407 length:246 start_codon:yes stop_codon:yes gene_type:complete